MIPIKITCACGQRYAFDIEPVNGRMPAAVLCPVCGADGTAAANEIIARALGAPAPIAAPAPAPAPAPVSTAPRLSMPVASRAQAPAPALAPAQAAADEDDEDEVPSGARALGRALAGERSSEGEKWKWWYFVLAGICIGGYSIWQAYDQHRVKPLGELFFAVFCIAIGIWDFQYKRRKKRMRG